MHALLAAAPWPGNTRELKNVMEYAVNMLDGGRLEEAHLPAYLREAAPTQPPSAAPVPPTGAGETLNDYLARCEEAMLRQALEACRYNVQQTAKRLGLPRQTLYYRLKKLGLWQEK